MRLDEIRNFDGRYYYIHRDIPAWVSDKNKRSHVHHGATEYYEPNYVEYRLEEGGEIHDLPGGTFYVPPAGGTAWLVRLTPPSDTPALDSLMQRNMATQLGEDPLNSLLTSGAIEPMDVEDAAIVRYR